jgi:hypothetical protein
MLDLPSVSVQMQMSGHDMEIANAKKEETYTTGLSTINMQTLRMLVSPFIWCLMILVWPTSLSYDHHDNITIIILLLVPTMLLLLLSVSVTHDSASINRK